MAYRRLGGKRDNVGSFSLLMFEDPKGLPLYALRDNFEFSQQKERSGVYQCVRRTATNTLRHCSLMR